MSKKFVFGQDVRNKILKGVETIANSVTCTLGPRGRTVIFMHNGAVRGSKDGVSVALACLPLKDKFENMGAELIYEASQKTCSLAGDGTTGTVAIARSIINEGARLVSAGHNPIDIKRGIDFAVEKIVEELQKIAQPVKNRKEIEQIGTISANDDPEVGKLIADALEKIGNDGIINIEDGKTMKTELRIAQGFHWDKGYISPHFVNNDKSECVFNDPLVLVTDKSINNVNVLMPILTQCHEQYRGRPLLIVAENCESEALQTLALNSYKRSFASVCVRPGGFGDRKKDFFNDIATLTGAQLISEDVGMKIENFDIKWLGTAKQSVVSKTSSVIIEGAGTPEAIQTRVAEIRNIMAALTDDWDRKKQEERLARLAGGVAIIECGAATEAEMSEKKDRIEDAVSSTRSAVQEGIVVGGGVALLRASKILDTIDIPAEFKIGAQIVKKAAEEPLKNIVENAGGDATLVRINVLSNQSLTYGYNARTEKYEDLMESGVIDPAKVIRVSLQNAASVAGLILTTEALIADEPEPKGDDQK